MAVSALNNILLLVALPALSLGLLSDYKICGDVECESKFKLPNRKAASYFIQYLMLMFILCIHLFTMSV